MNPTLEQTAIIEATAPDIVVIAGPGSGKTTTLVERFKARPSPSTAIITFTNAAADHLHEKIQAAGLLPPTFIGTLHAFALQTLRSYRPGLTLLDEKEAEALLGETIAITRSKVSPKAIRRALNAGTYASQAEKILAMAYRATLRTMEAEDFDTLLLAMLERCESRPVHIGTLMVDEFQDSGTLDAKIYAALCAARRFYVGDPDQAIYGFRGGRLENLLEVAEQPGTFTAFLSANFRCGPSICAAANGIIQANRNRIEKSTVPARKIRDSVTGGSFETELKETAAIVDFCAAGGEQASTAILCRYNHEVKRITAAIEQQGQRVYRIEPPEMPGDFRMALAALALVTNPTQPVAARTFVRERWGPAELRRQVTASNLSGKPMAPLGDVGTTLLDFCTALNLSFATRAMLVLAFPFPNQPWQDHAPEIALQLRQKATETTSAPRSGISVLTIHGAKGLEFDRVWIQGITAQAFGKNPEEDRRLLFVAITRARRELVFSYSEKVQNPYTNRTEEAELSPLLLDFLAKDQSRA